MKRFEKRPAALTIAGSDSGGGAGIQADLKTFAAHGVHGTSAITCLTAQNPAGVRGVQAASAKLLAQQIEAVREGFPLRAGKTGMLYSAPLIRVVVEAWARPGMPPLVVDPVMVATSGAVLLKPAALRVLQAELFPKALLLTPNLDEAALLLGAPIGSVEELRGAARALSERHGCAVLLKGGHLETGSVALDILRIRGEEYLLEGPRVRGVSTHGTGCTYSAAITAGLALGQSLLDAVVEAKAFISDAIAGSFRVGKATVLDTEQRCRH